MPAIYDGKLSSSNGGLMSYPTCYIRFCIALKMALKVVEEQSYLLPHFVGIVLDLSQSYITAQYLWCSILYFNFSDCLRVSQ